MIKPPYWKAYCRVRGSLLFFTGFLAVGFAFKYHFEFFWTWVILYVGLEAIMRGVIQFLSASDTLLEQLERFIK